METDHEANIEKLTQKRDMSRRVCLAGVGGFFLGISGAIGGLAYAYKSKSNKNESKE